MLSVWPPDSQASHPWSPASGAAAWGEEDGGAPVLRRLRQNREKRDSRIRASTVVLGDDLDEEPPKGDDPSKEEGK